jgi:repressor of nif and glnA expression
MNFSSALRGWATTLSSSGYSCSTRTAALHLQRGDRKQWVTTRREAHRELTSVGASPFVNQVESELKSTGIGSGRRSDRTSLEFTGEWDVVVLVSKGHSNPEV